MARRINTSCLAAVLFAVAALCGPAQLVAAGWCDGARRLGSSGDATVQEVTLGAHAAAVFLMSSASMTHKKNKAIVDAVAPLAAKFGLPVLWADEEGPRAEKRFVHEHGEGPLPRLVVFHDRPRGYHSVARLVSTELHAHGAEALAHRLEGVVADLEIDAGHTPSCPHRRVKRGFPGVAEKGIDSAGDNSDADDERAAPESASDL
jgi:hypothetical protein